MSARTILNARVVVGRIEPSKRIDGLFYHRFHVARRLRHRTDAERFVAFVGEFLRQLLHLLFVHIGEHD